MAFCLGQMGIVGTGQTTGVNTIVSFVQVLLKQSSIHVSPQFQLVFLFRSLHLHGAGLIHTTAEDSEKRKDKKIFWVIYTKILEKIFRTNTRHILAVVVRVVDVNGGPVTVTVGNVVFFGVVTLVNP